MKISIDRLFVLLTNNSKPSVYPRIFTSKEQAEEFQKELGGTITPAFINDN